MKIKDAVIKRCPKCKQYVKEVQPAQYGCDTCRKKIKVSDRRGKSSPHLRATIFYHDERDAKDIIFCSWKCCFDYLKDLVWSKKREINFISLPVLTFYREENPPDFFERIK